MPTTTLKVKRSFSISRTSETFLRREMKNRHLQSASQTLDNLLAELQKERTRGDKHRAVAAYYDSLTDADMESERAWGEFAGRQMLGLPE
jgi:uncharacterized membrane protein YccC